MPAKKLFYSSIIILFLLCGLFFYNYNHTESTFLYYVLISLVTFLYHLLIRFFLGAIGNLLTIKLPNLNSFLFKKHSWEDSFYKKIKLKKWKHKQLTFDPSSFDFNLHSVQEIKHSMVKSEVVHILCIIGSFSSIFFCYITGWNHLCIFLITALFASLFDLSLVFTQRYNRFRIERYELMKENVKFIRTIFLSFF